MRRWFITARFRLPTARAPSLLRRIGCQLGKKVAGKVLVVVGVAVSTKVTANAIESGASLPEAVAFGVTDYISPVSPEDIKRAAEEFDSWLDDSEIHENLLDVMGLDFSDDPETEFLK